MEILELGRGIRLAWCKLDNESGHEAGRRLLSALYTQQTGKPLPPIRIAERGKPYFEDSPLHFSITHTPDHAFCVLSPVPIGIDAEEIDRKICPALADKVLSPGERQQYDASSDKPRTMLSFWVLKEALVKRTGEGLQGYPNFTNFTLPDPRIREIDGCLVAVLEE